MALSAAIGVCLGLPNGPEIVELLLAIAVIGAAAAPLNPAYTHDEFRFYLEDLRPRVLLLPSGAIQAAGAQQQESTSSMSIESTGERI